jgi:hypothetical protein
MRLPLVIAFATYPTFLGQAWQSLETYQRWIIVLNDAAP